MSEREYKEELCYYAERYYAKPLEKAGFVNYRDDKRNWYQVYNGLICHFHIIAAHSSFPMLELRWWIHPTFLPVIINSPVSLNKFDENMMFSADSSRFFEHTVDPGHFMNVPKLPQRGAELLEEQLFPQMQRLNTREAVYAARREHVFSRWYENEGKELDFRVPRYVFVTPEFADVALVMNDVEMFPYCIERLDNLAIPARRRFPLNPAKASIVDRSMEMLEAQRKALNGIEVEQYFEMMKERKARFFKKYKLQDDFEL